jgi:hypothetical protein
MEQPTLLSSFKLEDSLKIVKKNLKKKIKGHGNLAKYIIINLLIHSVIVKNRNYRRIASLNVTKLVYKTFSVVPSMINENL